jgi:hypothetical protein
MVMPEKRDKPIANTERLLKKVSGQPFAFKGSQADLELVRSIYEGTCANAKPGKSGENRRFFFDSLGRSVVVVLPHTLTTLCLAPS